MTAPASLLEAAARYLPDSCAPQATHNGWRIAGRCSSPLHREAGALAFVSVDALIHTAHGRPAYDKPHIGCEDVRCGGPHRYALRQRAEAERREQEAAAWPRRCFAYLTRALSDGSVAVSLHNDGTDALVLWSAPSPTRERLAEFQRLDFGDEDDRAVVLASVAPSLRPSLARALATILDDYRWHAQRRAQQARGAA